MTREKFQIAFAIAFLITVGILYYLRNPAPNGEGVSCTQEALQCPDGSYVGRTGPNCEFVCPSAGGSAAPER